MGTIYFKNTVTNCEIHWYGTGYDATKAKWKPSDYIDMWASVNTTTTNSNISYTQIKNFCQKLTSEQVDKFFTVGDLFVNPTAGVTLAGNSQVRYWVIVPKNAVENGTDVDPAEFNSEMRRCFTFPSPTTQRLGGFYFSTSAGKPCIYAMCNSYTNGGVLGSAIPITDPYLNVKALCETEDAPDFLPEPEETPFVTVQNNLENCTSNTPDGTVFEEGDDVSITVTADLNYRFTESDNPTIFYDTTYGGTTRPMAISEDGKTATAQTTAGTGLNNLTVDGTFVINAKAYPIATNPTASVTTNLSNCVGASIPSTIENGVQVAMTFTANDGYEFKNAPTATYLSSDGSQKSIQGTYDGDTATLSFTINDLANDSEVLVTASASEMESETFSCTVVKTLSNAICEPDITEVENGSNVSIKLSPSDADHEFIETDECYLSYVNAEGETITVKGYYDNFHSYRTITIDGISLKKDTNIVIYAKCYVPSAQFDYSQIVKCTAQPVYVVYDEEFRQTSHQQQFIADDGYYFNGTVSFKAVSSNGSEFLLNATYDSDRTIATVTIPSFMQLKSGSKIIANAVAIAKEKQYEISTTFLPTAQQIFELSQQRYYTLSQSQGDYISLEQIDLGQYILSLRKMFVNLPSESVQSIILGFYNTNIVAQVFEGIKHTVECGVVEVSGLYGNSLDFTKTTIDVQLPFVGVHSLEARKVMNRAIKLVYEINVTAGECLAKLIDNDTNQVLYSFNGFCAYDIPYILEYSLGKAYQIPEGNLSVGNMALFHETPIITVRENDVVKDELMFGDVTEVFTTLNDLHGFNKLSDIDFSGITCLKEEEVMLREVLVQGAYFPDEPTDE